MKTFPTLSDSVECPTCREVIEVEIPFGAPIERTKDRALVAHNAEEHPAPEPVEEDV